MYELEDHTLSDLPKACQNILIYDSKQFKAGYTGALIFIYLQKAGYFQEIYLDPKYFNPNKLIVDMKKISVETLKQFEYTVKQQG